ncbi:MAG TPA: MFS transporter [Gaiellaceae bacterium]|nr:MFS transporter [Gaiellaceae bacterium]
MAGGVSGRAALGGLALAFTPGFNVANVGAVADRISHGYGVGLAVVGLFTTALFVTHAALQVPMGRLCDRFGPRLVGCGGLVIVAAASAAALAWREAAFAIAMRLVAGIGTAASFVGGSDYVRATIGTAVAQGAYGAVSMAGGGLALALVPLWASWRAPFASAALIAGAGALLVAVAPHEGIRVRHDDTVTRVFDPRLRPLAIWHSASFGLSVIVGNWVVTLLHRAGGESEHVAGISGGLVLLLGVISRPLGGRFLDRPAIVRASFLAGGAAIAVLSIAQPLALAVCAAAGAGLAAGIPFAPSFAGAQRLRPDAPGAAVGAVNMAAAVTILCGTPLLGLAFSLPGHGRIGFLVVAVLWAAAALSRPR